MSTKIMERNNIERKIISISQKRQITIPLKFFKQLNLENEVECTIQEGALVIRPMHQNQGEFSVEILKDLVAQGYSGEELIKRFELESNNIRKSIGIMLNEAEHIAHGEIPAATFNDIFETED